jgi:hypothetical protein
VQIKKSLRENEERYKFPGEVSTALFKDKDGHYKTSMIVRDVTKQKQLEDELKKTNTLLKLFAQKTTRKTYLDSLTILIQDWIQCRSIGIRLLNEGGYIPYESYVGFSKEFWESENWLSIKNTQCACIRVVIVRKSY